MSENTVRNWLVLAGIVFCLAFCLFPFIYMLVISLSTRADFLSQRASFKFTLDNFNAVLTDGSLHFPDYLRNSFLISLASAFFCVVIASLAAYAITRLQFPGRMSLLFFALAVSMFPQIGLVGYLFKFMTRLGWINTYQALVLPYTAWILPLSLWILVSYFSQIPRELDKAALVDGCTYRQILCKVILPVAAPGVLSVFLLSFIFAFNEFMFALMLTTDYRARTVPVGIALFQGLHGQTPWGNIMAASVVTTLPIVILTLVFQRHIMAGLTRGAVKG
ncbi:MAG: carbohydrate ABC transporter permease [Sedimentisphaerales bacterium]|nr:carbohydrate ABC transporter permease [Sedimentisphaerales bacterium]